MTLIKQVPVQVLIEVDGPHHYSASVFLRNTPFALLASASFLSSVSDSSVPVYPFPIFLASRGSEQYNESGYSFH